MITLPGSQLFFSLTIIIVSAILAVTGRYKNLELITTIMAEVLVLTAVVTAFMISPLERYNLWINTGYTA